MRTIRIKLYKFNELSEASQQKALEQLADINTDYGWWNCVYDDAKSNGLEISSFDLDRHRHATGQFILSANEIAQNIFSNHGEACETYKTAESFMKNWQPVFDNYMQTEEGEDKLIDLENDFLNSLLEDYSIILKKEYEYLSSEEAIKESIEANAYEFTKDGKLV